MKFVLNSVNQIGGRSITIHIGDVVAYLHQNEGLTNKELTFITVVSGKGLNLQFRPQLTPIYIMNNTSTFYWPVFNYKSESTIMSYVEEICRSITKLINMENDDYLDKMFLGIYKNLQYKYQCASKYVYHVGINRIGEYVDQRYIMVSKYVDYVISYDPSDKQYTVKIHNFNYIVTGELAEKINEYIPLLFYTRDCIISKSVLPFE